MLRTPTFWYRKPGIAAALLAPAAYLYGLGRRLHATSGNAVKVSAPVICIGNLTAGGSGKTPTVQALYHLIMEHGLAANPCILMRGYGGGKIATPLLVTRDMDYRDVGDEALLLAASAPVVVCADRVKGAEYAVAQGYDLILMDDGFQNPHLYKDFSLLVIDGRTGFGNGLLLPAGPLREPVTSGLARAHACLIISEDNTSACARINNAAPVFTGRIKAQAPLGTESYIGFCGLGQPEKFRRTLADCNINIIDFESYPDHHPYTQQEVDALLQKSKSHAARLITTEKDAVRLRGHPALRPVLDVLPIRLELGEPKHLTALLMTGLRR